MASPAVTWSRLASVLTLVLGLCCSSAPARAWTRADVESASAHVVVQATGAAEVELVLGLRVHGGWLSRFELVGLAPETVVDATQTPVLELEDGRKLTPTLRVAEGPVLRFDFGDKREAPRRGLHRLALRYATALREAEPIPGGTPTLAFTLPAFGVDLERIELWIDAPEGTELATAGLAPDPSLSVERSTLDGRTQLHLLRARLPRTTAFGAALVLPHRAQGAARPDKLRGFSVPSAAAAWAGPCLFGLYALKRRAARAISRLRGARPLPLVPLPEAVRLAATLGCGAAAAAVQAARPGLALALLLVLVSLQLLRGYGVRPTEGRLPASSRAQALLGHAGWLDATTPLGAGLLTSLYALACLRLGLGQPPGLWLETLLLATPAWLSATRLQLPQEHERPVSSAALDRRAPGRAA